MNKYNHKETNTDIVVTTGERGGCRDKTGEED